MIVAIAGMHRSGTSLFARYLHRIGIRMGDDLYVEKRTNPYGHYEDLDFLTLQREEIAAAFDGQDYLVAGDFVPSRDFEERAAALAQRKKDRYGGRPWGWKDPRTTLFLESWLRILPELRVVAMLRRPEPVVSSLCARLRAYYSIPGKNRFLRTYTHYNTKILDFVGRHRDRAAVVSLERLAADPEAVLEKVSAFLDYGCDPGTFRELFDPRVLSRVRKASLILNRKELARARSIHRSLQEAGR